jgi:hypothetical protein
MQQCQIIAAEFPKFPSRQQTMEKLRAAEMTVFADECERLAVTHGVPASLKMLIGSWIDGTNTMTIQPNAEVATLLEGLAKRFQ